MPLSAGNLFKTCENPQARNQQLSRANVCENEMVLTYRDLNCSGASPEWGNEMYGQDVAFKRTSVLSTPHSSFHLPPLVPSDSCSVQPLAHLDPGSQPKEEALKQDTLKWIIWK